MEGGPGHAGARMPSSLAQVRRAFVSQIGGGPDEEPERSHFRARWQLRDRRTHGGLLLSPPLRGRAAWSRGVGFAVFACFC
jgi:hypothetical protein